MAAPNAPAAFAITGGLGRFRRSARLSAKPHALLKNTVLPKPGEGPNKHQRENGFYKVLFVAKNDHGESVSAIMSKATAIPAMARRRN